MDGYDAGKTAVFPASINEIKEATMKIGILNAINSLTSQVNWQGTPVEAYIRFLQSGGASFTYTGFNVALGEFPESVETCDAYVITGSPNGVYDEEPWIAALMQFIHDAYAADKKLVGICFGHQVLAHALGGHTEKSDKGWGLGLKQFNVTTKKQWMSTEAGQYALYFAHQDQVITLPSQAELLGGNGFCPNAMFVMGNQVLGVQGHPEFTKSIMQDILAGKNENVSQKVLTTATKSLQNGVPDNATFARWIVNFLTMDD
jgi:GMP synthase-like glutamine amidotransferase